MFVACLLRVAIVVHSILSTQYTVYYTVEPILGEFPRTLALGWVKSKEWDARSVIAKTFILNYDFEKNKLIRKECTIY